MDTFECLALQPDLWAAAAEGERGLMRRAKQRLGRLVRHAQTHSALYRNAYRGVDLEEPVLGSLPIMRKRSLMHHFNDWVTDPNIQTESLHAFLSDPNAIGCDYLGRYAAWRSSGTTGEPGIFLHSTSALAIYSAIELARFGAAAIAGALVRHDRDCSGKAVLIAATGGHFAGISMWERLRRQNPWFAERLSVVSVLDPLEAIAKSLRDLRPSTLSSYPTVLVALADLQRRGLLDLRLESVWCGGEWLSPDMRHLIEGAFGCPVVNEYGTSEAPALACECSAGWMHVNSDWFVLEAIDRDGHPVPDGHASESCLLTNLANLAQPLIRYELGDSITVRPDRCECGSPFPALRVEGRRDDLLRLRSAQADDRIICPMALSTVIEETTGVHAFQVIQTGPDSLDIRVGASETIRQPESLRWVSRAVQVYLAKQGVRGIRIQPVPGPLNRSPVSGKLRQIVGPN
ncbi:MAG: AMP-binding protein [Burkholderiaceae bacterium]